MSLASFLRSDQSLAATPFRLPAGDILRRRAAKAQRPRLLMVSSLITMPYRVLRVAGAAGADIYVLGNSHSKCLEHSRFCKKFLLTSQPITGEADACLADEINRRVREFDIDMVLPGDVQATRSLIALRDAIDAPCFPMPTLEQFDRLNDKWFFTNLCGELDILTPKSWHVADAAELRREIEAGRIPLPAIAKPINHDGSLGVIKLDGADALAQLDRIDYAPIIVQEFIEGADIGASVYCERGEIKAFIAHELKRATYRALDDARIEAALARVMGRMGVNGVFNFDMRLAPDGTIYYLECNPRFFFKINLSMLAGVNFIRMGLRASTNTMLAPASGAAVRMPKALAAAAVLTPWKITSRDFQMLWYLCRDPVSSLREALGIDWEYAEDAHHRHFIAPATEKQPDRALAA
ncbi:MAG TPA: ATP-grasp domain-containing protein [Stellaceae bacterium]